MDIKNKIAIVTGSSSGVGAETAVKLAALGAKLIVNYVNSKSGADATVERIVEAGGEAVCVQADISDNAQCVKLVADAVSQFGQIDILVNNAGTTTFVDHKKMDLLTDDIWQETLATNLLGPFYMSRAVLPELIKQGGGEIVMTSSIAGLTAHGSSIAYCASKAGVNSMTKTLAKAMGEHHVRVNAICPGLIDGKWGKEGWGESWESAKTFTEGASALGRVATPEDIADSIVSIITGTDLMTAQIITVDGGFTV